MKIHYRFPSDSLIAVCGFYSSTQSRATGDADRVTCILCLHKMAKSVERCIKAQPHD